MNVLVLGNAGYIGTVLTTKLLEQGHIVTGIDWGIFGLRPLEPRFTQIRADVRYLDSSYFKGIDAVIDLAAISNDPAAELDPAFTRKVNWIARLENAILAREAEVSRYILASSCSVYGAASGGVVTEESPLYPVSTYARAAVEAEKAVLSQQDGMIVTVLRQGTVYGYSPRMRWDLVVNTFVRDLYTKGRIQVHGDGYQWRPHLYIEDTAKVMAHLIEIEPEKIAGKTFNVVGENETIRNLANNLADYFGGTVEYVPDSKDTRNYRVDGSALKWVLLRYPGCHIREAAEILWEKLENEEVDPNLPSTVEVYKKHFGVKV